MPQNSIRSLSVFAITTLLLFGVVAGSILLAKNRSIHYASIQNTHTASPKIATGTTAPLPQPELLPSSNTPAQQGGSAQSPSQQQPSSTLATPPPKGNDSVSSVSTPLHEVPATGPSITEHAVTGILMMCAAYLGFYLVRAKADQRP